MLRIEKLEYIHDLLKELCTMAGEANCTMLVYLLEMATIQAAYDIRDLSELTTDGVA